MKRTRLALVPVLLGLLALLAVAGPAAAQEIIATHGQTGDWGYSPADDDSSPGAKCGYSAPMPDGWAHLRWIKVRGPIVVARDTTGGRDHQTVSWQVKIQRQATGGAWQTMASSSVHSATSYDDTGFHFTPVKVNVSGNTDQLWRAVILLKWLRNGGVEGWTKARIEFYGVKWTVGAPDYFFTDG
ncbi:MAG: hypothetical protein QFC55_08755, partial [Chloroflexota bacterium]|nr:hypothetical protein [Chloroflexota bacterium]